MHDDDTPEAPHAREAEWRWGETDAYKVSQARYASYSKDDIARAQAENGAVVELLAEKMRAGLPSDHDEVMALAELHRELITKWWYPCSYEMQVGLSDMYVHDARFTKFYDDVAPGLAQFLADAILANAVTHGASTERASLESLRAQMGVRATALIDDADAPSARDQEALASAHRTRTNDR